MTDRELGRRLIRISGCGSLLALCSALPAGLWYVHSLPAPVRALVAGASPTIARTLAVGRWAAVCLLAGFLLAAWRPARIGKPLALAGLAAGLMLMGSFEWTREAARRPYVLHGSIYSNGQRVERDTAKPFLSNTPWSRSTPAGQQLFKFQCYACHTIGGVNNDIIKRISGMDEMTLAAYISQLHAIRAFMPPFMGTVQERQALAAYLVALKPPPPMPSATTPPSGRLP